MNRISSILAGIILCFAFGLQAGERTAGVVSLAPSITYSIYALGLESEVAGITMYCPKGATKKELIGSLIEPNIEKIVALKPRVVMVSKEGNRQEDARRLEKLGIEVFIAEHDYDYASLCSNFMALGRFLGAQKRAKEIIDTSTAKLDKLQKLIKNAPRKTVFWEIGSKPLFTACAKNFINDYSAYTASTNIFSDLGSRFAQVSVEEVIRRDPDFIFIVAMEAESKNEVAYWNNFKGLKAVRHGNVRVLDWSEVYAPTPENFVSSAGKTARLMHPEVFKNLNHDAVLRNPNNISEVISR